MSEPGIFDNSLFDRIALCIPSEQHATYYRYVAHLRSLDPKDELLLLAMGIGFFTVVAQRVPEAMASEREQLIDGFTELCRKHEATTVNATTDTRNMFAAHQKLLEQNIGTWQSREQQTVQALERIATNFEKTVALHTARLHSTVAEIDTATREHRTNATRVQHLLQLTNWHQIVWPCIGCGFGGGLVVAAVVFFWSH